MNVGSLFSGIGGFDLGFERAGMRVLWQVEQDAYCRAVLEQHFPDAQRFNDVHDVGAGNLASVDLLCGGFPCQDLSSAGKGAGLAGARSGLWFEFARLIRELGPRYVVVENVPGLLTGKGKRWDRAPIGRVLSDLSEMGYDAEWSVLSAREFGAPHLRKRVWIVAYPSRDAEAGPEASSGPERERAGEGGQRSGAILADSDQSGLRANLGAVPGGQSDPAGQGARVDSDSHGVRQSREPERDGQSQPGSAEAPQRSNAGRSRHGLPDADCGELRVQPGRCERSDGEGPALLGVDGEVGGLADADCRGGDARGGGQRRSPGRGEPDYAGWWEVEPDVGRVADGVPSRVDRLAALGNALLPQIAEWIGRRILEFEEGGVS